MVQRQALRLSRLLDDLLDVARITQGRIELKKAHQCGEVHPYEHQGHAVVEISDNGTGIAPELLPRIFDLFVQGERSLDRSQGGLGIGLAVSRQLLELHEGSLTAASDGPGCGSTFTVRLPVAYPHCRVPRRPVSTLTSSSRHTRCDC